jgi:hypothetical protein
MPVKRIPLQHIFILTDIDYHSPYLALYVLYIWRYMSTIFGAICPLYLALYALYLWRYMPPILGAICPLYLALYALYIWRYMPSISGAICHLYLALYALYIWHYMSSIFVIETFCMANKLVVSKAKAAEVLIKYPVLLMKLSVDIICASIRGISLDCVMYYRSTFRNVKNGRLGRAP